MAGSALLSELPTPSAPSLRRAIWRCGVGEGDVLGGSYRLITPLGRGGMSVVFQAEHLRLGHRVAVKLMAPLLAGDGVALARFRREAELLAKLHHPHIVRVIDYDTTPDGEPYIVMDLVQGTLLSDEIDARGTIALHEAVQVVQQIGSALTEAHRHGVLHRDLKPTNVMIEEPAGGTHATLMDFGIAKHSEGRALTQSVMVGTPEYMAPEQTELGARIDGRADQYALALCAFEMLSGCQPFWHSDVSEVIALVRAQNRPHLSELGPRLPDSIVRVIERAMSREPDARYRSVTEFSAALRAALRAADHADDQAICRRVGDRELRVVRRTDVIGPAHDLTPRDAFVLSRLDSEMSVDELLDASALPERDALRAVCRLLERGLVVRLHEPFAPRHSGIVGQLR